MEIESLTLQNSLLSNYVSYIYTAKENDPHSKRRLIIFPNVGSAITFYFNTEFKELNYQSFSSIEKPGTVGIVLHINRIDPIEVLDEGRQDRMTFVFHPLGINHFISQSLSLLAANENPSNIPITLKDPAFADLPEQLAPLTSAFERKNLVESFLLKSFKEFQQQNLKSLVKGFDYRKKLTAIAKESAMTMKTMERLFHNHLGITPVEFKNILHFRNSVNENLKRPKPLGLLAVRTDFEDLPYMIRVYKKFTKQTAKTFFRNLSSGAGSRYIYQEIV